jgi:hypothetical protein
MSLSSSSSTSNDYDGLTSCILGQGPGVRDPACGICHEVTEADVETVCDAACQNTFHKECLDGWTQFCRDDRRRITCPMCRATLEVEVADDDAEDDELDSEFFTDMHTPPDSEHGLDNLPVGHRRIRRDSSNYYSEYGSVDSLYPEDDLDDTSLGRGTTGPFVNFEREYFRFGAWGADVNRDAWILLHLNRDGIPDLHGLRTYADTRVAGTTVYEIPPDMFALAISRQLPRVHDLVQGTRLGDARMDDQSYQRFRHQTDNLGVIQYEAFFAPPNWNGVELFLLPIYPPRVWERDAYATLHGEAELERFRNLRNRPSAPGFGSWLLDFIV